MSIAPAIIAIAVAYLTAALLAHLTKFRSEASQHSFRSIDGLRGYLAFAVFLHHGAIWYFYLKSGHWGNPPNRLYAHFGQVGVSLFFMITGLLFGRKILDARSKPIDWLRLYIGRIFRLTPLYLLAVSLMFLIVLVSSGFQLREPLPPLAWKAFRWILFAALGASADLNGVSDTGLIFCGVTWTLTYEWFFYFSLPLLAFIAGGVSSVPLLAVSALTVIAYFKFGLEPYHLATFATGITAAAIAKSGWLAKAKHSAIASITALLSLLGLVVFNESAHDFAALPYLAVFFIIVSAGNSLFGILHQRASILLGEISYGIYLFHGLLLWVSLRMIAGDAVARTFSENQHWLVLIAGTPLLVCFSYLTFRRVERPMIEFVPRFTKMIRARFGH